MSRDRALFVAAAAYDLVLGAGFFFLYGPIFGALGIALPTNTSYIHISAAFVFVQGIGYAFVARDLDRNHDIVRLGVVYKAMYVAVAVYETLIGQLISAVFLWFAAFDLLFLVLFLEFLRRAGPPRTA
jgi:hypothetical protein